MSVDTTATVAEEIIALHQLTGLPCKEFTHRIKSVVFPCVVGMETTAATVTVPDNTALLVTRISMRGVPLFNDAQLAAPFADDGGNGGDWKNIDWDVSGNTWVRFWVNNSPIMQQEVSYFSLLNRPIFFVFKDKDVVELKVYRQPDSAPATMQILLAWNSFMLPVEVLEDLKRFQTQFYSVEYTLPA
jgi:hypothetical protein